MSNILLTRDEAATALRISVRNLDSRILRGELNVRRIGRRVLIHVDEVNRFANGPEPPAGSSANDNISVQLQGPAVNSKH